LLPIFFVWLPRTLMDCIEFIVRCFECNCCASEADIHMKIYEMPLIGIGLNFLLRIWIKSPKWSCRIVRDETSIDHTLRPPIYHHFLRKSAFIWIFHGVISSVKVH
jgi:hypothetical protein